MPHTIKYGRIPAGFPYYHELECERCGCIFEMLDSDDPETYRVNALRRTPEQIKAYAPITEVIAQCPTCRQDVHGYEFEKIGYDNGTKATDHDTANT